VTIREFFRRIFKPYPRCSVKGCILRHGLFQSGKKYHVHCTTDGTMFVRGIDIILEKIKEQS
jgi:hypothetical protein